MVGMTAGLSLRRQVFHRQHAGAALHPVLGDSAHSCLHRAVRRSALWACDINPSDDTPAMRNDETGLLGGERFGDRSQGGN